MAAASIFLEAGPRRRCDGRLNASSGASQGCENGLCYVHVYNLFRPTNHPALLCAVRSDHVVPTFINTGDWEFVDALSNLSRAPLGFTAEEADEGMRYNGFYLFLNYAALPTKAKSIGYPLMREAHRVRASQSMDLALDDQFRVTLRLQFIASRKGQIRVRGMHIPAKAAHSIRATGNVRLSSGTTACRSETHTDRSCDCRILLRLSSDSR